MQPKAERGRAIEQLNIEGKRSGDGFVAHKAVLVNALSRALSARVVLLDFTVGRKGLFNYLKALAGSNVVKIVPANGSASESQATAKRLKVVCGANTSYISDNAWIREAKGKGTAGNGTPFTFCEVRVSPSNTVTPNVGASELAEALNRVLPFLVRDDARPVLACVNFVAKDGKLQLVSADGFRLAVVALDYEGEGNALINYRDLQGMANALKRAKRARISFETNGKLEVQDLVLDTDLIHYKWTSVQGSFPDWQPLIPTDGKTVCHFDTIEAVKAIGALKALADSKMYAIDLAIGEGKVIMTDADNKGQADINADVEGEPVTVRLNGGYLTQALRACGGMVDLSIGSATAPMLFTTNGYRVVQMPMARSEAKVEAPKTSEPKADVVAEAEAVAAKAEATSQTVAKRPKQKRKAKQLATVA